MSGANFNREVNFHIKVTLKKIEILKAHQNPVSKYLARNLTIPV